MDAFCQNASKHTYAECVDAALSPGKPVNLMYGEVEASTKGKHVMEHDTQLKHVSREQILGALFMNYHQPVFEARRPPGKTTPGTNNAMIVALHGDMCRVEYVCYMGEQNPDYRALCEPVAVEWALRDANGIPDAVAAEAAMETIIVGCLALCK